VLPDVRNDHNSIFTGLPVRAQELKRERERERERENGLLLLRKPAIPRDGNSGTMSVRFGLGTETGFMLLVEDR
jgi:hypothetical protein